MHCQTYRVGKLNQLKLKANARKREEGGKSIYFSLFLFLERRKFIQGEVPSSQSATHLLHPQNVLMNCSHDLSKRKN